MNAPGEIRTYLIRLRGGGEVPEGWQDKLPLPGIKVIVARDRQAAVRAKPEAIPALKEALGADFLIEEDIPRRPL